MEQGFRERAERVVELLTAPDTAYVLVASPRRDTVDEASFFAEKLGGERRRHRGAGREPHAPDVRHRAAADAGAPGRGSRRHPARRRCGPTWPSSARWPTREDDALRAWPARWHRRRWCTVPFLSSDVHDLDGLAQIGTHLFAEPPR